MQVLKSIKILFITHMHSDHSLGILQMIQERNLILKKENGKINEEEKVVLIIPFNMIQWYESFNLMIEDLSEGCDVLFIQKLSG